MPGLGLYKLESLPSVPRFTDVEANTVVGALLLVCAVGCDVLTAFDPIEGDTDAPSSLRVSSLVLIALAASPIIDGIALVEQRSVLGVVLAALAFAGNKTASENLRTGDAAFTVLALLASVQIYHAGGIESNAIRPDSVRDKPHRRQTISALCAALMFYSGCRGLRSAFVLPMSASQYTVTYRVGDSVVRGRGYAHSSSTVSTALGFGHGVIAATGVLLGLHKDVHVTGSATIALEVTLAGVVACVAALWAFLACCDGIYKLPVLYESSACLGRNDVCPVTSGARRFAISNESTASLWVSGLALLVFGSTLEKRLSSAWNEPGCVYGSLEPSTCRTATHLFRQLLLSVSQDSQTAASWRAGNKITSAMVTQTTNARSPVLPLRWQYNLHVWTRAATRLPGGALVWFADLPVCRQAGKLANLVWSVPHMCGCRWTT